MKVILPENQREITLAQYQELVKLQERTDLDQYEMNKRKLKIFTKLSYQDISLIKADDMIDMLNIIDKALNEEVEFEPIFTMHDVEFGFIPNFDDIKSKEYFDLTTYDTEVETLHRLMAILYRPIKNKSVIAPVTYEIVSYNGSKEWSEAMKQTPLSIVNGALVFFYNLAKECQSYILKFIPKEQVSQTLMSISESGAGYRQFTGSQKGSPGDMIL